MQPMRIFKGSDTRQINYDGRPADPNLWYYEPADYAGGVLWSPGDLSREDAIENATLERANNPELRKAC